MPRYLPLAMVKKEAEEKKGGGGEGVREERGREHFAKRSCRLLMLCLTYLFSHRNHVLLREIRHEDVVHVFKSELTVFVRATVAI